MKNIRWVAVQRLPVNIGYRLVIKKILWWLVVVTGSLGWFLAFTTPAHSDYERFTALSNNAYLNDYPYRENYILKPNFADIGDFIPAPARRTNDLSIKIIATNKNLYGSCVGYARKVTRFSDSFGPKDQQGWAKWWPINSQEPTVGSVIVTTESFRGTHTGHVGIITRVSETYIEIREANYISNTLTEGRRLPINSPLIIGYWSP